MVSSNGLSLEIISLLAHTYLTDRPFSEGENYKGEHTSTQENTKVQFQLSAGVLLWFSFSRQSINHVTEQLEEGGKKNEEEKKGRRGGEMVVARYLSKCWCVCV